MIDRYTKIILTVIALCLLFICLRPHLEFVLPQKFFKNYQIGRYQILQGKYSSNFVFYETSEPIEEHYIEGLFILDTKTGECSQYIETTFFPNRSYFGETTYNNKWRPLLNSHETISSKSNAK